MAFLVFVSGFTSLVYQVVWERTVRYNFGGDTISSAIVTATFLLGLGLGAVVFGRWHRRAFATLAVVELAIGAYALGSYHVLAPLATVLGGLFGLTILDAEGLRLPVVIGCVLFLLPPCILIGGTLPLMFNCFIRGGAYRSRTVGLIYGLNTAGAAAGVLAAPFLLLNRLSLPVTLVVAGMGNLLLGVLVWLCGRRAEPRIEDEAGVAASPEDREIALPPILALGFLSGVITLVFEISLFRALSVLNPSSAYNFPAVLIPFLCAMALGSTLLTRVQVYTPARALRRVGLAFLLAAIAMLLGIVVSAALSRRGWQVGFRYREPWLAFVLFGAILAVPVPLLLGGVFPLLLRLASRTGAGLPRATGLVYLANSLGAFGGAMLAQFAGFRLVGTRGVLTELFLLGVLAGGWTLCRVSGRRGALAWSSVTVALAAAPILVPDAVWDVYTYGVAGPSVDRVEGVTGVATIEWHRFGGALFINGQFMSLLPDHPLHVRLVSFALMAPRRERVLVLGLGGGGMVRELVQDSGVHRVDAVDWSYELPDLLEHPRPRKLLANSLRSPKVWLCRCDARVAVRLYEPGSFDVVINNLARSDWVGATGVKSLTHFGHLRRILKPSGILVYHGNFGRARRAVLAGLAISFRVVWEHEEEMVLASDQPLEIDGDWVEQVLERRARAIGISGPPYTDWFIGGLRRVSLAALGGAAPIRDELLVHEYHRDPLGSLVGRWRTAAFGG
ncbi:MAG: hypothetical protein ACRELA_17900 [Candidatus Rokuibacteriota bacterium]